MAYYWIDEVTALIAPGTWLAGGLIRCTSYIITGLIIATITVLRIIDRAIRIDEQGNGIIAGTKDRSSLFDHGKCDVPVGYITGRQGKYYGTPGIRSLERAFEMYPAQTVLAIS